MRGMATFPQGNQELLVVRDLDQSEIVYAEHLYLHGLKYINMCVWGEHLRWHFEDVFWLTEKLGLESGQFGQER